MQIPARMRKQEFTAPAATVTARVATVASGTFSTAFDNASAVDGVTLATGDIILIKNQASAAENGLWVVPASGSPTVRAPGADSVHLLNNVGVEVTAGNQNSGATFFQNNVLSTFSSAQSWSTSPNAQKWTVPDGVFEIEIQASGGGGGGGGGGGNSSNTSGSAGGGGGGGGAPIVTRKQAVTPGDILSIVVGGMGLRGIGVTLDIGTQGAAGRSSTVSGTGWSHTYFGGGGGGYGGTGVPVKDSGPGTMAGGGSTYNSYWGKFGAAATHGGGTGIAGNGPGGGGGGSIGDGGAGGPTSAAVPGSGAPYGGGGGGGGYGAGGSTAKPGGNSIFANGGTFGATRGGGGGGASWGAGAAGGSAAAGSSAGADTGGGGGGGAGRVNGSQGMGQHGGHGGSGKVILYWVE